MHQRFSISPEVAKRAKWPHEIFLINLIFNHVFLLCATAAVAGSIPLLPGLVPVISFAIICYIHISARQIAESDEPWFVMAHWQICASRNRFFMLLLTLCCVISGSGYWLSRVLGWAKIPTIALIGGVGLLPFMAALLVLIVLGNESVYMARNGELPEHFLQQNPTLAAMRLHTQE